MTTTTRKTEAQLRAEQLWDGWFGFFPGPADRFQVHPESNRQLPPEAIADCSGPGPADQAVSYWVDRLGFDGPSWLFRSHLREYGCWDDSQLCDHQQNRQRVLWLWANDCRESPGERDFLWLVA